MADDNADKSSEKFHELDKRVVEVKKDVEWQLKLALTLGLLILAMLGFTSFIQVPREVRAALKASAVQQAESQARAAATNAETSYKAVESIAESLKKAKSWGWGDDKVRYGAYETYTASSDGLVMAYAWKETTESNLFLFGRAGTNSYSIVAATSASGYTNSHPGSSATLTLPVREGDTWIITHEPTDAGSDIRWFPLTRK